MNYKQNDLLENARILQCSAYDVIEKIELLANWRKIGKPELVGSMCFGLMGSHNIDLEVYTEAPDIREGFDVIKEIAACPGIEKIEYMNFMGTSDPGLYWRIDYRDGKGDLWDIDNWLVPYSHPNAGQAGSLAKTMEQALTDETRLAILEIKSQRTKDSGARGIDIYRAVIEHGIRGYEDFCKWLANNQCEGIDTWLPKYL